MAKVSGLPAVVPTGSDKLYTTQAGSSFSITMDQIAAWVDHGVLAGLGDDDHTQYALLAGRTGGQVYQGGNNASDDLTLQSTAHATKGSVVFGSSTGMNFDETTGQLSIGITSGDGLLHVHTASAGTVTAHVDADDVVVENSVAGGFSVLNPLSTPGYYMFGNPSSPNETYLSYAHGAAINTGSLTLQVAGSAAMTVDSSQQIGFGISNPDGHVHIHTASAGSVTAVSSANGIVLENSVSDGMSFLVPASTSTNVAFGDVNNPIEGRITYNHGATVDTGNLNIEVAGASALHIDSSQRTILGSGIGTADGQLHVYTGSAGSVVANTNANEAVFEGGGAEVGVSILSPDASVSNQYFGSPANNQGGYLQWNPTSEVFTFGSNTASGEVLFKTGASVDAVRVDSIQNVGLSVVPEIWQSTSTALQVGGTASFWGTTAPAVGAESLLGQNVYNSSAGNESYLVADEASVYLQTAGTHTFKVATAGVADATITWVTALAIANDGSIDIPDAVVQIGSDAAISSADFTLGATTPAANGSGQIKMQNSSTQYNWMVAHNQNIAGAFEVTPSTATGGTTFTGASNSLTIAGATGNVAIGIAAGDGKLHVHTGSAGAVTAAAEADDIVAENSGDGGYSVLVPDANDANVYLGSVSDASGALFRWNHDANLCTIGTSNAGASTRVLSGDSVEVLRADSTQDVLIGLTASNTGKVHIDQASTTGAKPVLTLDQGDVSEEFLRLIGTSTTDASQSLVDAVDLTTPGTLTGWIKVFVQDDQATNPITDGVYFIPFYTAPTA